MLELFQGTLKDEGVYWNLYNSPADARRPLATSATTEFARIGPPSTGRRRGPSGTGQCIPRRTGRDDSEVAGMGQAARMKLLEMAGQPTISDIIDN